jgi:tRNA uridine 5-carbamoylmethylation protein Kti12
MPVYILRGIPGSGKSYLAEKLIALPDDASKMIVSADHYFIAPNGEYLFNPRELPRAHSECFRHYMLMLEQEMRGGRNPDDIVIVDNTNIHAWEISPYVLAANAWDVPYKIVNVHCSFDDALRRQTHGVSTTAMSRMFTDFQNERLPPFWHVVNRNAYSVGMIE